jgi:hypothetical protein
VNELDHLRTLRSEIPERSPEELTLLTGWRPGGREFRAARRPRRLPLVLSGLAVVAAAVVFLALVVFPDSLTVGVGPAVDPSEEATEGTVEADPMDTMGPLIEEIGAQEQTGTVWYTRVERTEAMGVGPAEDLYTILYRSPAEHWRDTAAAQSVSRHLGNSWALASEEQRAAWERDGSPQEWTESVYGEMQIPQDYPQELGTPYDDPYHLIGNGLRLEGPDLAALPTDPGALRPAARPSVPVTVARVELPTPEGAPRSFGVRAHERARRGRRRDQPAGARGAAHTPGRIGRSGRHVDARARAGDRASGQGLLGLRRARHRLAERRRRGPSRAHPHLPTWRGNRAHRQEHALGVRFLGKDR